MAWKKIILSGSNAELSGLSVDGNITGVFQGALSSSAQIAVDISGSFVSASNALGSRIDNVSSTITLAADSGTNDTYTTGETLTFEGDNSITTTVSDNKIAISIANGVVSSSAQIAADISGSLSAAAIVGLGADIVSGSSFSGSFQGNGSNLTDITVSQAATVTSNFSNQTSVSVDHNFDSRNVSVTVYNSSNELILPASVTLSTVNRAVVTFDLSTSGFIVIAKGGHIVSGSVDVDNIDGFDEAVVAALPGNSVSASVLSTPSQGSVTLTTNGVANALDLGLQTGDSPTFVGLTLTGDLEVRGTTTTINSTTVEIGDNIVALNGSGATLGGLHINDANGPKSGSLLWDGANNKWIAGQSGSEVDVALLEGQGLLSQSAAQLRTYINVEDGADVTDTANVTAAGALMDSELAEIATVKALTAAGISGSFVSASNALGSRIDNVSSTITLSADSGTNDTYTTGETLTFEGDNSITTTVSDNKIAISIANGVVSGSAQLTGTFLSKTGDTVVSGSAENVRTFINVEDGADVTDTANVTAAGALMDSEVASLALIKSLTAASISGSFVSASNALGGRIDSISTDFADITNKPTLISASIAGDAQGQIKVNGVNVDVTGLQTNDSPQFDNLTVSGDLTVTGNTFEAQVTNLNVKDRFITVNSGSNSGESGIVFGGSDPAGSGAINSGSAIFWDSTNVFGFAQDVGSTATTANKTSKLGNIETSDSNPSSAPTFQGTGTTHVNESDQSIWIFS